jgi:uncharacterized membrane protein
MTGAGVVFLTTFLAAVVEAIEMVTIVVGVGATRGYRYTLIGAAVGLVVLAIAIAVGGIALAAIPIGPLRLVIGSLLLLFGLQWYRKGIVRVAARGFAGYHPQELQEEEGEGPAVSGFDWTAWFLAFKGVTLEGLEIAIIVVSFGASAGQLGPSILGGAAAIAVTGATGFAIRGRLERIPRSFLQQVVGTLLASFGTFWALEGLGVTWPQSDGDIVLLLVFYALSAAIFIGLERRARRRLLEVAQS